MRTGCSHVPKQVVVVTALREQLRGAAVLAEKGSHVSERTHARLQELRTGGNAATGPDSDADERLVVRGSVAAHDHQGGNRLPFDLDQVPGPGEELKVAPTAVFAAVHGCLVARRAVHVEAEAIWSARVGTAGQPKPGATLLPVRIGEGLLGRSFELSLCMRLHRLTTGGEGGKHHKRVLGRGCLVSGIVEKVRQHAARESVLWCAAKGGGGRDRRTHTCAYSIDVSSDVSGGYGRHAVKPPWGGMDGYVHTAVLLYTGIPPPPFLLP